jgi:hypothetical protein
MKKLVLVVSVACLSGQVFANTNKHATRLDFESFFKSSNKETNTYASLLVNRNGNKINHNESFSDNSFSSLNENSDISIVSPGFEIMQEFFEKQYVSIGLSGRAAIQRGSGKFSVNQQGFKDEYRGYEYGAGLSLNLNTVGFGMRVQPFYAAHYMMTEGEAKLSYDAKNNNTTTKLNYKVDTTRIAHSLGLRFIDKKVGIASFVSLDYNQMLDDNTKLEATYNDALLETNASAIEYDNVSATIGFGFAF